MALSSSDLERYARHIVLREIGGPGQQKLLGARVLVVGAGGLGSPALLYLAAAGVGQLVVVDDDSVSLSNLQRQILFDTGDIGVPKADAASESLKDLNPGVNVISVPERLNSKNAREYLSEVDLVLDGCDNFETRYLVNQVCIEMGIPLLSAAISQWEGQIGLFDPDRGGPCYACIFPVVPGSGLAPTCAEAGVVGALPGVVGSMMALEAIKFLTGAGIGLNSAMLIYDGLHAETRRIKTRARQDCPVCLGIGIREQS